MKMETLKIDASNYSLFVDKMHELLQSHSTGTIKNLYQNLNIGCRCQHRSKRQLFTNKIITFFNNEADNAFKETLKKSLNTKNLEIYCIDSNSLILNF